LIALINVYASRPHYLQILHPVKWEFRVNKISSTTYQFHAIALLDYSWHIYSRLQPDNAVSTPTQISFDKTPDIQIIGYPREIGTLIKFVDKQNNIGANEYSKRVDFVQIIKVSKTKAVTLSGKVTFQVCTDRQCLPPDEQVFRMSIE